MGERERERERERDSKLRLTVYVSLELITMKKKYTNKQFLWYTRIQQQKPRSNQMHCIHLWDEEPGIMQDETYRAGTDKEFTKQN